MRSPREVRRAAGELDAPGRPGQVLSHGSAPAITDSSSAQSRTVRPNGPIWSSDDAKAIGP